MSSNNSNNDETFLAGASKFLSNMAGVALISASLFLHPGASFAENELADKYGNGKGFDSSLVDQTCLVDKCSLQAKACLADDPDCRKGLTCTAKCMGDNTCITGCMARYGDENLDNLLKCTIEDNNCIKIAILDGGADEYGQEPRPPAPTIPRFNMKSMEGTWYKVVGFNPNYDCYACQRNTFSSMENSNGLSPASFNPFQVDNNANKLQVDVEFSMPRMLPDGSPPPPKNVKESLSMGDNGMMYGSQSVGFNDYATHETMVFDTPASASSNPLNLKMADKEGATEKTFARTAHSEGEMFGLKFWENWYVIGENDPSQPEFKFVFYNGKTRQNTYEGAFVYSRTRDLGPEAMSKVYKIASDAGMNPDNFCKIRNGCFEDTNPTGNSNGAPNDPFLRRLIASTKISQLLGVEPVAAEGAVLKKLTTQTNAMDEARSSKRAWWYEVGDYLENPNRHFELMDNLRITMDWPEEVKNIVNK